MSAAAAVPAPWRPALAAWALLVAAVLFCLRDTAVAMVTIWMRSETFTHAFLVPPISAWLAWRQRHLLAALTPRPAAWALAAMAVVALSWLLGELVAVNSVTQLALVALLVLTVPAVLGTEVARQLVFPLGFLFFAVPVGEFLMPQFMDWTADFTVLALRATGIPVYREGLQFVIPSGAWSVVEACSGIRYLIASLTVGTLFAYLNYRTWQRRWAFVGVSILVPIVANWLRAYIIVMLGHLSGNKLAVGVDHLIYGWLFFGVVIALMFLVGARWAQPPAEPTAAAPRAPGRPAARPAVAWGHAVAGAVLVALAPAWAAHVTPTGAGAAVRLELPDRLAAGWAAGAALPTQTWEPAYRNPSARSDARYAKGELAVGLHVAYYRDQDYERKLVSSENVLVVSKDDDWAQVARGARRAATAPPLALRTAELRPTRSSGPGDEGRLVVWYFYWVDGRLTASDHLAKVYGALGRLFGHGDESAAVFVYAPKTAPGGAEAALDAFLRENLPAIEAALARAAAARRGP